MSFVSGEGYLLSPVIRMKTSLPIENGYFEGKISDNHWIIFDLKFDDKTFVAKSSLYEKLTIHGTLNYVSILKYFALKVETVKLKNAGLFGSDVEIDDIGIELDYILRNWNNNKLDLVGFEEPFKRFYDFTFSSNEIKKPTNS